MRAILLFVLSVVLGSASNAEDFKYEKSFYCGPQELNNFENYKTLGLDRWKYFFVNIGRGDKFVVLNDDIQYTNFRDTLLNQMYYQNGGTFRATLKEVDDVMMFRLFDKESDFVKVFNVDWASMTYVSRVIRGEKKFPPTIGACWSDN